MTCSSCGSEKVGLKMDNELIDSVNAPAGNEHPVQVLVLLPADQF